MKQLISVALLTATMFLCNCSGEKHFITDAGYRKQVESQFEGRRKMAHTRDKELFSVFDKSLSLEQQEALKFLFAYMPLSDLADYNGAIMDLNKAISLNDTFSSAYNYRGIVYINLGDYPSSLFDFNKTLSLNPNHPFTHNNIGIALAKTGQNMKAVEYFSKAISLDKKHGDAYYNRGKLLLERGDYKKAKPDILTALEINYQNPDAHYLLALIYIQEKKKNPRLKLEEKICTELETASGMNHPKAAELFSITCEKIEPVDPQEELEEIESEYIEED